MSLKIDEINAVLAESGLPLNQRQQIVKNLEAAELEKKKERIEISGPKSKKKFVVLLRGPQELSSQLVGARVLQVSEDKDVNTIVNDLSRVKNEWNSSIRKQALRVTTWVEFFSRVKAKFLTAKGVWNKSKAEVADVIMISDENVP